MTLSADFRLLGDDARDTSRPEASERRKPSPVARLPLMSPIGLISILYALSLYMFYRHEFISGHSFVAVIAALACCVMLFHAVFHLGLQESFRDQSLILQQIVAALLIMLIVAWAEPATQLALVPFVLIAFSFGLFRLSTAALAVLALACLAAYFGIIVAHARVHGYGLGFRADLVQWCVLALTLPGMAVVARKIEKLRQLLGITRRQLEHYEEKSARDDLTGLFNRRRVQAELENVKRLADTRGTPFSICLIDIDRFKEVNDGNGHLVGDAILRGFAATARTSIRDSDILGRYGGDEFIQILPETELQGAVMHAERLRVRTHFIDFGKQLAQQHISLSIGVAQYRSGDRITDLISRADSALYLAKQRGRNRVEWIEN